ncbi:MAG TPA: hypothetical protein VKU90_11270 [Caulobacteraceae bacterium]|nr:hypothetical protein [Caulobacteraceae bacterium]
MSMFEFGRELKRFFRADALKDGLTGGDASLLELLDLDLLRAEGKAADVAAGRISAKDRARRYLEAARVWREIARRTGDVAALRKAASSAEQAAAGFDREKRIGLWAAARCEQAGVALLGAELFGDDGLNAAADVALQQAESAATDRPAGALARAGRALIEARALRRIANRQQALTAAARFEAPVSELEAHGRRRAVARLYAAQARIDRADFLAGCGLRLKEPMLLRMAIDGAALALKRLDPAYEPLSWARAEAVRRSAEAGLSALDVEIAAIAKAVNGLVSVLETLSRDDSPLDWAAVQASLAEALQLLGEATDSDGAYAQAAGAYARVLTVLDRAPSLPARAEIAFRRTLCLARRAELAADLKGLRQAENALRAELAAGNPAKDAVGWAVRQLGMASLHEARVSVSGRDRGERGKDALALAVALDVFKDAGLRSLADEAARALDRARRPWPAQPSAAGGGGKR